MHSLSQPIVFRVRSDFLPLNISAMLLLIEVGVLFLLAPELINACVEDFSHYEFDGCCGSAAAHCGKPMAFRADQIFSRRLRLRFRGVASADGSLAHKNIDTYANLNPKRVVRRARKLWVLAHVSAKVEDVHFIKILLDVLPHAVECQTLDETVIGNESNNAFIADSIRCPAEGFHVRIRQSIFIRRL